jgi:hypothetical protein
MATAQPPNGLSAVPHQSGRIIHVKFNAGRGAKVHTVRAVNTSTGNIDHSVNVPAGQTSAQLSGLEPGSAYQVQAEAHPSGGQMATANVVTPGG